jgi:hypothetical protein
MWRVNDAAAAVASLMLNTSMFLGGASPSQVLAGVQHGFREGTWKAVVRATAKPGLDPQLRERVEGQIATLRALPDDAFADRRHWAVFRCFGL